MSNREATGKGSMQRNGVGGRAAVAGLASGHLEYGGYAVLELLDAPIGLYGQAVTRPLSILGNCFPC